ncbi:carbamoyl-phosphate synthase L chain, ATP binding domain protein [Mycobacterium kansasii 824]|nr:carbamoyl-phosphate synthase L chain, ATP binding domain protein [Mycobacterium kansasii 824]
MIGADFDAIQRGEDRQRFKDIVTKVGGESARSRVCFTMDEVRETVDELGLPVVVRPSFTMGGLGSGWRIRPTRWTGWPAPGWQPRPAPTC